jgi:hypothetical protein
MLINTKRRPQRVAFFVLASVADQHGLQRRSVDKNKAGNCRLY